ncbi:MAG: TRAP transporter large permease [Gammaproteobacteria bacterium]
MTAPFLMFAFVIAVLMAGFPVAFALAGGALIFAAIGAMAGIFDASLLSGIPSRIYGVMTNETLIAVPLFVFMGTVLEQGKIAERLLEEMGRLFGRVRGGLAVSVCLVGAVLAASTGIVGATVVTMGLLSLPVMLRHQYCPRLACGVISASGTLGQIIPPSIVLVILGDVIGNANQLAQLQLRNFSPEPVSVGDLFLGALIPGLMLVLMYVCYVLFAAFINPSRAPLPKGFDAPPDIVKTLKVLVPPAVLIFLVLGSILFGIATPTEAAAVGAGGALALAAINRRLSLAAIGECARRTTRITCMVFLIFIGAGIFSLVFRGFGGDAAVTAVLESLPGGLLGAMLAVMILMFILGFFLDFIEIVLVVVPVVAPALIKLGADPVWLGVMIAVNLQTSFLTPPFGFALFYLRGVAPKDLPSSKIYRGAIPFVCLQLLLLLILWHLPQAATWLPDKVYG